MTNETVTKEKNELAAFLKEDTLQIQKQTRTTWIAGTIITVALICYMSIILYVVRGSLQPETAARMIAMRIEDNLPTVLRETEVSLEQQAPVTAGAASNWILESLPTLRQAAEHQIDMAYVEILPLLRDELSETLRVLIRDHRDEFAEAYEMSQDKAFVKNFIDEVAADMVVSLDTALKKDSGGKGVEYFQKVSLNFLTDVNESLEALLEKKPGEMTRSERLQRRSIVLWLHILEQLARQGREEQGGVIFKFTED